MLIQNNVIHCYSLWLSQTSFSHVSKPSKQPNNSEIYSHKPWQIIKFTNCLTELFLTHMFRNTPFQCVLILKVSELILKNWPKIYIKKNPRSQSSAGQSIS